MATTSNLQRTVAVKLSVIDTSQPHTFIKPVKRINEGHDVSAFLTSKAYADIVTFVMQLNLAMCPRRIANDADTKIQSWELESTAVTMSESVTKLMEMLRCIESIIEQAPPDTGPRRFGNISFRKFYEILEGKISTILDQYLPANVLSSGEGSGDATAKDELSQYLLGAFGSPQRLDYGTGHELSFMAFLGGIWKLGGFIESQDGNTERSIVLGVMEVYLHLIRRLILTYTLEPAGSHGVWGLDDHSFAPYIFGSAQFCPPIQPGDNMPIEGALSNAPNPADISKKNVVDRERKSNMYFAAVGFINDVKTGPFWEHSPILFDISGVKAGWGKINKGMLKMYNAEVLSKFPVVQHFPFGSLFSWEQDAHASPAPSSVHTSNQPSSHSISVTSDTGAAPSSRLPVQEAAKPASSGPAPTAAPWAARSPQPPSSRAAMPATRAPWANPTRAGPSTPLLAARPPRNGAVESTRAPWAT